MDRANQDIRDALKKSNVKQWELAERFGLSANYFVMKLRKELPESEKIKMFSLIQKISEEKGAKL